MYRALIALLVGLVSLPILAMMGLNMASNAFLNSVPTPNTTMPLPASAQQVQIGPTATRGATESFSEVTVFTTAESPAEMLAFYRAALIKAGWHPDPRVADGTELGFDWQPGCPIWTLLLYTATAPGHPTTVSLVLTSRRCL